MTVKAVYENGVFRPKDPVELEDKTEVEIDIRSAQPAKEDADDPTGWKAIDRLMGIGKAVAPDVAERHDDYLYGDPHD